MSDFLITNVPVYYRGEPHQSAALAYLWSRLDDGEKALFVDMWRNPDPSRDYQPSSDLVSLVAHFEGFRAVAYRDPVGVLTIGYGRTEEVSEGQTTTEQVERDWMAARLGAVMTELAPVLGGSTTPYQREAIASLAYNVGVGAVVRSTLVAHHRAGRIVGAYDQFLRWVYAGGRVLPGLVRRRNAERAMYVNGNWRAFI